MKKVVFLLLSVIFLSCGKDSNLVGGKVLNSNGEPIENALIQVMGTDLNSSTDPEGKFRINTKNRGDELIITHPDYEMSRIEIEDNTDFSIELKEKTNLKPPK